MRTDHIVAVRERTHRESEIARSTRSGYRPGLKTGVAYLERVLDHVVGLYDQADDIASIDLLAAHEYTLLVALSALTGRDHFIERTDQ